MEASSVGVTGGHAALLERDFELERLESALDRGAAGQGSVLYVEGPAGIGKTALLESVRGLGADRGMRVLAARGGVLERDFAYGVPRGLFEREVASAATPERKELLSGSAALAGQALGFDSGLGSTDGGGAHEVLPVEATQAVLHGLYWLTSNLAARAPLLLVVDDAHWADEASLRFLVYLGARVPELPVTLVVAARPREPGAEHELVDQLAAGQGSARLRPAPLSVDATRAVVADRLGGPVDDAFAETCQTMTGGNPFLIHELAEALHADGSQGSEGERARIRELGPDTVSRALLLRLARMPRAAGGIATAVAVLGNDVELNHAAELADVDPCEAAPAVDALVAAQILTPEHPLNFVHPIVASAVYSDLGPGQLSAAHARAADLLAAGGASDERVASHLLHVVPGGGEIVAVLGRAAEGALEQGAPEAASRYLRRALEEGDAARFDGELLCRLGEAEYVAGEDPAAAVAHLRQGIPLIEDTEHRAAAWLTLSRTTMTYVGVPEAVAVLDEASEDLEGLDADARTRIEVERNCLGITHPDTYAGSAARMDRLDEVPGDTTAERLVLCNLAYRSGMLATSLDRTLELSRRALAGGALTRAESLASNAIHQANYMLLFCDAYEEAKVQCDIALADAVGRASAWAFAGAAGTRGGINYFAGDLPGCEADTLQALEAPGCPPFAVPYVSTFLALALIERGDLAGAEAAVDRAWPESGLPPIVHMELLLWARARVRAAQGRDPEALADLLEYGERSERVGSLNPAIPWRADAALACARLGEADRAQALAAEHLAAARAWGARSVVGIALRTEALIVGGEEGIDLLREAVEELASSPARLEHARALADLGGALRRAGRRRDAREPLREGLEAARRCGATALVERAHEELVTAGARPRKLMFSGAESLTASERRVAGMAATGQSNREIAQALFVTIKTVENHLSRVYGKLGIRSRKQLAEALGEPAK